MSDKFLTPGSLPAGTTSVSRYFSLRATTTGAAMTGKVAADMICSYWRQGGVRTAITPSNLAAVNSAYSAGGVKEVDATNCPGLYRFDIPDAATTGGADWAIVSIVVTGAMPVDIELALPVYDALRDALFGKVVEIEGSYTAQQVLSILLSFAAGQTTNSGTTLKTSDGAATRIAATIDGSNNRTTMTVTPSV